MAAYLFCNKQKPFTPLNRSTIPAIVLDYRNRIFPALLLNTNVPDEDKKAIQRLLKKPWNLYVRRHTGLTDMASLLKEMDLRALAGWSRSPMQGKYVHYFGNHAAKELLKAKCLLQAKSLKSELLASCS